MANSLESVIHPATRLGAVHLTVSNLERALVFYQQVLGFQVQEQAGDTAKLGAGREPLLVLTEQRGARQVRNHSGLYHFAILTPSRLALAESLRSLVTNRIRIGGSDHLVSEAIYLSDPDGNGIEIYRDRPRSDWAYEQNQVKMDTLPLDYQGILAELGEAATAEAAQGWAGLQPETVIGHIHLHVGDLAKAKRFYQDAVGFAKMMDWGEASFLSAGGYHHHLGINTWAGVGAPPTPADAVGLRYYEVYLPDVESHNQLIERVTREKVAFEVRADGLFVQDPSQNGILFVQR